ncbi:MAG: hypothetical protein MJ142_07065, partial [Clostridia bacterium]|nr:hypothetical protein [Clostridia bacterium]
MTRLKRVPVWIVAMVVSVALVSAYAESLSYIRCDCLIGKCQCFIQLGDEGGAVKKIITILIEKNYLPKKTPKGLFSEDV